MNGVWVAKMDSENYEWIAVGKTKDEAIDAIVDEWQNGLGHERRDTMTREKLEDYYGIGCNYYEFGTCHWR